MSHVTRLNESCHACCKVVAIGGILLTIAYVTLSHLCRDVNGSCHSLE